MQKWLKDAALQVIQIVNQDEGEAKDWACQYSQVTGVGLLLLLVIAL